MLTYFRNELLTYLLTKYHYTLAWDTLLTPEISKYGHRPFTC